MGFIIPDRNMKEVYEFCMWDSKIYIDASLSMLFAFFIF